jgi:molecular chaperone Hsp33
VAEDVAHYLAESEQIPSALALGVFVGADAEVKAAGGFLVQALPGAHAEHLAALERSLDDLPAPSQLVRDGHDAHGLLRRVMQGIALEGLETVEPVFHCSCEPERVRRAVSLLGREETREMARRGERIEVRCEFCAREYSIDPDEVAALHLDA